MTTSFMGTSGYIHRRGASLFKTSRARTAKLLTNVTPKEVSHIRRKGGATKKRVQALFRLPPKP